MLIYKKLFVVACAVLILTGCAQTQQSANSSRSVPVQYATNFHKWAINGKVGVSTKDEGHNISIDWHQNQDKYKIRFYSPFSSDSAVLEGNAQYATLRTSDGNTYQSTNPDTLFQEHFGWTLPFTRLAYWIKGQVAPQSMPKDVKYDAHNQLVSLQQDGWTVRYRSYEVIQNISLPEKMSLNDGKTNIKLVINDWQQ